MREAIEWAQDGDSIRFDPAVFTPDDDVRDNIADVAQEGAGNDGDRMILVSSVGDGLRLKIMTLQNSNSTQNGAALASSGLLSILDATFTNTAANDNGGALCL